jgi:hypothetical protein
MPLYPFFELYYTQWGSLALALLMRTPNIDKSIVDVQFYSSEWEF